VTISKRKLKLCKNQINKDAIKIISDEVASSKGVL